MPMALDVAAIQEKLASAGTGLANDFVSGIIALVLIVVIMAVGYIVAWAAAFVLGWILGSIKLEKRMKEEGLSEALLGFTLTSISTVLLKLFVLALFLGIAADVVQIAFLSKVAALALSYIPSLTEGIAIIAVALVAGEFITDRIKMAKIPFANTVGIIVEVFIAYNGIVIALPLILPNASVRLLEDTFKILIIGVVAALGLGGAIALGLGLKDTVSDIAKKKKAKLEELV